ncbi:MAG TPA: hypothetical protein V6D04_09850 [Candidatus Obscuribacterales bacterium]
MEFTLHSDAGDGYGVSRLDRFRIRREEHGLELIWEAAGDYEFPYSGMQLQVHGMEVQQAWIDDLEVDDQQNLVQCDRFQRLYLKSN